MWLSFTDIKDTFGTVWSNCMFSPQTLCFMITCQLTVKRLSVTLLSLVTGNERMYRKWYGEKYNIYFALKAGRKSLTLVACVSQSDKSLVRIPKNTKVWQKHEKRKFSLCLIHQDEGRFLLFCFSFYN